MRAMVLSRICDFALNNAPLELMDFPEPQTGEGEILIKVTACGVCHTELDEIEGRTPPPRLPVILGHQVVGTITKKGLKANRYKIGERVGVAWIYSACGTCKFCLRDEENLCPDFKATGRDANGGYAEYMTVPENFVHPLHGFFSDVEAAPLLCAGAIGYRSLRLTGHEDGQNLGLTGFGASAHLVLKMVKHRYPNSKIFVFARNERERDFARAALFNGELQNWRPSGRIYLEQGGELGFQQSESIERGPRWRFQRGQPD